jgi:hypothetical protein
MPFAELLIAASLGCSFGYVLGAIVRTGKQADIAEPSNLQSAQFRPIEHKAKKKSARRLVSATRPSRAAVN